MMEKDLSMKNEIEVTFSSSLPADFQVANNRLSIPTSMNPEKLRKLLNKLLNKEDSKFIFFIENILLDSDINSFLSVNNFDLNKISETGLVIHYSFEIPPPELIKTIKEDEWIRKVVTRKTQKYDASNSDYYLVGLFNSEVTFYTPNFEKLMKVDERKNEDYCELLHDVVFFSPSDNLNENIMIKCSRNEDALFSIYSIDLVKVTSNKIYIGEKLGAEYSNSLSVNPTDFSMFASGNTDGSIRIYKIGENVVPSDKKKKRKTEYQILSHENVLELTHGTNEVRLIKWINNNQILSAGDDFYIKLWNIHTKTNYSSFSTNFKLTTCICPLAGGEKFLTGHDDGSIRLWDSRNENTRIVFNNAHSKYVSEITANPDVNVYSHNFASVGYDGFLKVWDMRAMNKPIYDIKTDSEKNYSLSFNSANFLITGGDNSTVNIYENKLK